ncbi:hypothetical protein TraAM80_05728 [Trypanosoma rangeli]|uniref:Uncharacterized protein n=1 Tax=Trypanosoma rangeli TaxID=5698 RepID=A0A422ND80_TRYRA|nr:uncharacterized protein TraAM80_05728 [Trypanosoma rangeli]RNF03431.1 hypothetical protein TraAM80_05728 [Trypanosoma rangeli]|eukprot:RNF03431.1 hypothetical protein TraAM80_05728 [Trypanosoma rangeli]
MALIASCGGIYFTETPVENIITLTWQVKEGGGASPPYSSVIFKVKSSAPKLFYVHPRYGALLVTDGAGQPHEACRTQVTFGLRPVVTDTPSEIAATTAQPIATSPGGGGGYNHSCHERIVFESMYIPGCRAAYEPLLHGLAAEGRFSEVVRGVWELVVGGTHQAVRGAPISLKVYMEGVTTDSSKKGEGVVVVPPTAKLVQPLLRETFLSRTPGTLAGGLSLSPAFAMVPEKQFRSSGSSELRALKRNIDALCREPDAPVPDPAASAEATYNSSSKHLSHARSSHTEADILMRTPNLDDDALKASKDGVPLFMVLTAMFCTYVVTMLFWRTV